MSSVVPSKLQDRVLSAFREGRNVVVEAVAGAGKTTVFLLLARDSPREKFLLLTYNKKLCAETREKAAKVWGLTNIEVHTYHSFCRKQYVQDGYTDKIIREAVLGDLPPRRRIDFSVVLLDEQQDCTTWYYWLTRKILRDNARGPPRLVLCGDRRQCINQYKGADDRFLTKGQALYGERSWAACPLDVSLRIPAPHAAFVDACMLGGRGEIRSAKAGPKPVYLVCDVHADADDHAVLRVVEGWLAQGIPPGDIMVLAPGLRKAHPVMRLEKLLQMRHIPCYVPTGDDREPCDEAMLNKVCFSTFHQAKGRERKCTAVYSFDASYFKYYARGADVHVCPNTMYVAATRSLEHMVLVQDAASGPLPFLDMQALEQHADVVRLASAGVGASPSKLGPCLATKSVTELLLHLSDELVDALVDGYAMTQVSAPEMHDTYVPSEHGSTVEGSTEEISDINGNVATTLLELHRHIDWSTSVCRIFKEACSIARSKSYRPFPRVLQRAQRIRDEYCNGMNQDMLLSLPDIAFCCAVYTDPEYVSRVLQLRDFNWWDQKSARYVLDCFDEYGVDADARHEVEAKAEFSGLSIVGRFDLLGSTQLTEVKYVKELQPVHKLQLMVYAWLHGKTAGPEAAAKLSYDLLNTRTRECWRMGYDEQKLEKVMRRILQSKNQEQVRTPDDAFLAEALRGPGK